MDDAAGVVGFVFRSHPKIVTTNDFLNGGLDLDACTAPNQTCMRLEVLAQLDP